MRTTLLLGCTLALLLVPARALSAKPGPWLELTGGAGTYTMTDINVSLEDINALVGPAGPRFHTIRGGTVYGAAAGIHVTPTVSLGAAYDRLEAATDIGDPEGAIRYRMPADLVRGLAEYAFQRNDYGSAWLGVAGGAVFERGHIDLTFRDFDLDERPGELRGSGPMAEMYVGADRRVLPWVSVAGTCGFRSAKIMNVKQNGEPLARSDGSRYSIDYSGIYVRMGLRLARTR